MYEEKENKIDWMNIVKKILLLLVIIAVIFGIITLVSRCSRKDKDKAEENTKVVSLTKQLDEFENAIIKYVSKETLPIEINSSKTIRLKLLANKELVKDLKDEDNNVCDTNESYAEITRLENNYAIKLSLTCGSNKDYRVIYVGCFEECNGGICKGSEDSKGVCTTEPDKKDEDKKDENKKEENKGNTTTTNKPINNNTTTNKKPVNNNTDNKKVTLYQYQRCEYICEIGTMNNGTFRCEIKEPPMIEKLSYTNASIPFKNNVSYITYRFDGYSNGMYNYTKYTCGIDETYDQNYGICVKYTKPVQKCDYTWSKETSIAGWTRTGNTK